MHLQITQEEMEVLRNAKQTMDWSGCTSGKLRYLYQRYIALPAGRLDQIKEISALSTKINQENESEEQIINPSFVVRGIEKPPEFWVEQGTGKRFRVNFEKWKNEEEQFS